MKTDVALGYIDINALQSALNGINKKIDTLGDILDNSEHECSVASELGLGIWLEVKKDRDKLVNIDNADHFERHKQAEMQTVVDSVLDIDDMLKPINEAREVLFKTKAKLELLIQYYSFLNALSNIDGNHESHAKMLAAIMDSV